MATHVTSTYNEDRENFKAGVTVRGGSIDTKVVESTVMVPVDIQGRYQKTVQTHTGVSVAPSSANASVFIDANGYSELAITLANDSVNPSSVDVYWSHDGVNYHGGEYGLMAGSTRYKAHLLTTKARYVRINVGNLHTAPTVFSAWVYLKA